MFYCCTVGPHLFIVYIIFYLNVRDDDDDVGYEHAHTTFCVSQGTIDTVWVKKVSCRIASCNFVNSII